MQRHHELAGIVLLGLSLSCQAPVATEPETLPGDPWHSTAPPSASGMDVSADGDDRHGSSGPDAGLQASLPFGGRQHANPTWTPQDGLPELLRRAEEEGPTVLEAYFAWLGEAQMVEIVSSLPDPRMNFGGYLQAIETRNGPMNGRLGIQQAIPWPGRLEAQGQAAEAMAEASRWRIEEIRLKARSAFLKEWTEMAYLQEAILITRSQVILLEHIEDVSLRLYESSRVAQADVLRAQVERLEMEDRLETLQQKTRNRIPRMEKLLGAQMEPDSDWSSIRVPQVPPLATEEEIAAKFSAQAPSLNRLQDAMDAARAEEDLADLEDRPDLTIGADWTWIGQGNSVSPDAGDDAFSLSLSLELPVQRERIHALRRKALANQRRIGASIDAAYWELSSSLEEALSDLADAERRLVLYRDRLLPKGEETHETTLVAYQSGQSGFQEMLDAARVILDFRLAAVRASADAHLAFADLNGLLAAHHLTSASIER